MITNTLLNYRFPRCLLSHLFIVAVFLIASIPTSHASNTLLLIVESDDCIYCKKFDREIAQAYPLTEEGKLAPLRRINVDRWPEAFAGIQKESITPTFILVSNNVEIDRLRGYPGDEYFWFLLNEMLNKLPIDN